MKTRRTATGGGACWRAISSAVFSLAPLRPARSDFECTNTTMCGALAGPVTCADGTHVSAPFDCNALCQNPGNVDTHCATFDDNPCLEAVCGSAGECGNARPYVPSGCDDNDACTTDTCDACADNCSGACVHQPDFSGALGLFSAPCSSAPYPPGTRSIGPVVR